MPRLTCPAAAELSSFLLGQLSPESSNDLELHIDGCEHCQEEIRGLNASGNWIPDTLKDAGETVASLDASCRAAIERIAQLDPSVQLKTPEGEELGSVGVYKLLAKLGEGGMGAVYKAQHTRLRRMVAIKVLPANRVTAADAIARFDREMQAVGALDHQNIVRAFDAGDHDGRHYIAMEYVRGRDVSQLVKSAGALPVPEACEIIRQAAIGLQHAHEAGLVHRDIKPGNLMLTDDGVVKILDLGLALLGEAGGAELTTTGQVMGTLDYMAPEQGGDTHHVDIRADIYSLGASLYKLLAGEAPFGDPKYDSPVKKLMALATVDPIPLQQRRADVPKLLSVLVQRMLAKSAADRPKTPADVATALAPFCKGANLKSLTAPPPKPVQENSRVEVSTTSLNSPLAQTDANVPALPIPQPKAAPLRKRPVAIVAALLGTAALLALGIILFMQTPRGTVRIEINDDKVKAVFGDHSFTIEGADKKPIRISAPEKKDVKPGEYWLHIQHGDFDFQTKAFQIEKKGETILKIELLDGVVQVARNDRPLDQKPLSNNVRIPSTLSELADYALAFDGPSAIVDAPDFKFDGQPPLTIEAWITPRRIDHGNVVAVDIGDGVHFALKYNLTDWHGVFSDGGSPSKWQMATVPISGEANRRDHVAVTWNGESIQCFVNGKAGAPVKLKPELATLQPKGGMTMGFGDLAAIIDEVRFSKSIRYREEFTPKDRFEPDVDTLALYHFDEGTGDKLVDSSGKNRHGKVIGAKWVRLDESAFAPPAAIAPFNAEQAKAYQAAWAKHLGVEVSYSNRIGMRFMLIPPGEYLMGSTSDDADATPEFECPRHKVKLTRPFYLGAYEVTQGEYEAVMAATPAHFKEDVLPAINVKIYPVEMVSWNDAAEFCTKLSQREKLRQPALGYRLPTDAQWEFACRAGTTTRFCSGDTDEDLAKVAWFHTNSEERTHAAGDLKSNPFGLFDMHGNVWEWVHDWSEPGYYEQFRDKVAIDPTGPASGTKRGARGGQFRSISKYCRSADRGPRADPTASMNNLGFRVALSVEAVRELLKRREATPTTRPLSVRQAVEFIINDKNGVTLSDGQLCSDLKSLPEGELKVIGFGLGSKEPGAYEPTDEDLARLRCLTDVERVYLARTKITSKGLQTLSEFAPKVRLLSILSPEFDDEAAEALPRFPLLQDVEIKSSRLTHTGLKHLAAIPALTQLGLPETKVSAEDLKLFAPKLEYLLVGNTYTSGDWFEPGALEELKNFSRLSNFHTHDGQIKDEDLPLICQIPGLTRLHMDNQRITDKGLKALSNARHLNALTLGRNAGISDEGMDHLAALPGVVDLALDGSPITDAGLKKLSANKNLKGLSLTYCPGITQAGIDAFHAAVPGCTVRWDKGEVKGE